MAIHIRRDDIVEVIAGDDKGKRGRVLRVDRAKRKVVVENVNRVYKHLKRSQKNPQGGRLSKEMPIDISNVMLIDPKTNEPTRVGIDYRDGVKVLVSRSSDTVLRKLTGAKKKVEQQK